MGSCSTFVTANRPRGLSTGLPWRTAEMWLLPRKVVRFKPDQPYWCHGPCHQLPLTAIVYTQGALPKILDIVSKDIEAYCDNYKNCLAKLHCFM